MVSTHSAGLLWCVCFVLLESAQAVFFGRMFQKHDAFLVGTLVFGLSTAASISWIWITDRAQLVIALACRQSLVGLNVTAAGGWLAYLLSIQMIEPAVSFALFSGAVPLTTVIASRWNIPEVSPSANALQAMGKALIAIALIALAMATLTGLSGFVRGGVGVAVAGIALALASGSFITLMLFYGQRLHACGVGPLAQFGLRFGVYLMLSLAAAILGLDSKGPAATDGLILVVGVGLLIMAFPIYAVQKAISLVPTLTIATVTGIGPLCVYLFQMAEGRVCHSPATLSGLCVYFAGAVLCAIGEVRSSIEARARAR